ncbi:hypothetical protein SAMN06265350_1147 [Solitalea koreensis]|uniref:Uncharacterized protein n=1 Tax=Solitalea koreensis TaxID=543615 RepID=A0A521EEG2_9SPHI|nr:hypothetical protein SAMN06265350_1147 [Solitalea koreensis]
MSSLPELLAVGFLACALGRKACNIESFFIKIAKVNRNLRSQKEMGVDRLNEKDQNRVAGIF